MSHAIPTQEEARQMGARYWIYEFTKDERYLVLPVEMSPRGINVKAICPTYEDALLVKARLESEQ